MRPVDQQTGVSVVRWAEEFRRIVKSTKQGLTPFGGRAGARDLNRR